MKFYGTGKVWDKEREKILCTFTDGEFETSDQRTADILIGLDYKNDGTEVSSDNKQSEEVKQNEEVKEVVTNEPSKDNRNTRKNN